MRLVAVGGGGGRCRIGRIAYLAGHLRPPWIGVGTQIRRIILLHRGINRVGESGFSGTGRSGLLELGDELWGQRVQGLGKPVTFFLPGRVGAIADNDAVSGGHCSEVKDVVVIEKERCCCKDRPEVGKLMRRRKRKNRRNGIDLLKYL